MRVWRPSFDCRSARRTTNRPTVATDSASENPMSKAATYQTSGAASWRRRLRDLAALVALALASLAPAPAAADDGDRLRVMTQNLYVGSFFLTTATTPS